MSEKCSFEEKNIIQAMNISSKYAPSLHHKLFDNMKKNEKSINPIIILRNLNYFIYFSKNSLDNNFHSFI